MIRMISFLCQLHTYTRRSAFLSSDMYDFLFWCSVCCCCCCCLKCLLSNANDKIYYLLNCIGWCTRFIFRINFSFLSTLTHHRPRLSFVRTRAGCVFVRWCEWVCNNAWKINGIVCFAYWNWPQNRTLDCIYLVQFIWNGRACTGTISYAIYVKCNGK